MITKEELKKIIWDVFEEEAQAPGYGGYASRDKNVIDGSDWNMDRIAEKILAKIQDTGETRGAESGRKG